MELVIGVVIEVTFDLFDRPRASRIASVTKSISLSVSKGPDGKFNPLSDSSRLTGACVGCFAKGGRLDMGWKKGRVSMPFMLSLRITSSRTSSEGVRIEYIQKILGAFSSPGGCRQSSGSSARRSAYSLAILLFRASIWSILRSWERPMAACIPVIR
jgi:hypothetical protein